MKPVMRFPSAVAIALSVLLCTTILLGLNAIFVTCAMDHLPVTAEGTELTPVRK